MPTSEPTLADIAQQFTLAAVEQVRGFIPPQQLAFILELMRGEEGQWFAEKIMEIAQIVETMPSNGQTDGQGMAAIAHLHYFGGSADWYITEKDKGAPGDSPEDFQSQAFGRAERRYRYISLPEIFANRFVELDLHWKPRPLEQITKCRDE